MRKNIRLVLTVFLLACVGIGIIALLQRRGAARLAHDCAGLSHDQVGSERALGLVVQSRRLLSIRLSSEKNYSPPGGHIKPGEGTKQALVREFMEEMQVSLDLDKISDYKVACAPKNGSIERSHYFRIESLPNEPSLRDEKDKLKYVTSDYSSNNKSDSELSQALYYLKSDNLID